jgi:hypothetical protein
MTRTGVIDIPLIPRVELMHRLQGMRGRHGPHLPGEGVNLKCVEVFTGITQTRLSQVYLNGDVSNRTQILLSQFFHRWDKGEISFSYDGKKWSVVFNNPPVQRYTMVRCARITNGVATIDKIYGVQR